MLKKRDLYLKKIIAFKDTEPIKVITGIRRCGKSSLLKLMILYLKENNIPKEQIIEMNFESYEFKDFNNDMLYNYVKNKVIKNKKMYLFFDEVQHVKNWEVAINAFRVDFDSDIYITGSNAYMLSSEYATYLSGRLIEIKMLPLSFREFLDFHDFELMEEKNELGNLKKFVYTKNKNKLDINEVFNTYVIFGGMPGIADIGLDQEKALSLLDGIYSTIIMKDILERENKKGKGQISDPILLKKITMFLADNIGNNVSMSSIANTLMDSNNDDIKRKSNLSSHTIESYVDALLKSYFFYDIKRFDIKGKDFLRTLGKYYIVDIGLRNYLLGLRDRDSGHILENIVYFELLRRGYDVAIGKVDNLEIDFIATKADDKKYFQVTRSLESEDVRKRELSSLKKIKDNYEKIILTLNKGFDDSYDGIKAENMIDWLLSN